jgi:hypothetical protein
VAAGHKSSQAHKHQKAIGCMSPTRCCLAANGCLLLPRPMRGCRASTRCHTAHADCMHATAAPPSAQLCRRPTWSTDTTLPVWLYQYDSGLRILTCMHGNRATMWPCTSSGTAAAGGGLARVLRPVPLPAAVGAVLLLPGSHAWGRPPSWGLPWGLPLRPLPLHARPAWLRAGAWLRGQRETTQFAISVQCGQQATPRRPVPAPGPFSIRLVLLGVPATPQEDESRREVCILPGWRKRADAGQGVCV